ncbi:Uncharacterized protein conserved in cyanobacteria [Gloeomargarita lithophora Alchichica-D10]|uniref:Uncharacterized protein conserved in cyanobacteria n=1 Tax=Gloeomargarita lithophora Alchichica-D10 TaxID=1188229 RepID=A0A1J0ACW8_9CYAN|nr:Uma2 family endonuclease [Gloeomargarita lithophora]APB33760.1 Uncharacterized protein conserved in cyanobacteria [Gloeomargarita lithophora Alchichica-D10]
MTPIQTLILTLTQYHRLIAEGYFPPDERVELIAGQLQFMSPQGTRHTVCCMNLLQLLIPRLPTEWRLRCQDPITLLDESEPEPDMVIVKTGNYLTAHPTPGDIILIIEIADTSLAYDREIKAMLYAQAGISNYWLINLVDNQLEVFTKPHQKGYPSPAIHRPEQVISLPNTTVNFPLAPLFPTA